MELRHEDTFCAFDHDQIVAQLESTGIYMDTTYWLDCSSYGMNKLSNKNVLAMLEPFSFSYFYSKSNQEVTQAVPSFQTGN